MKNGYIIRLTQTTKITMNKGELIEAVQSTLGEETSKKGAEAAVKAVLENIASGVKKDGSVQLLGFGTFEVRNRSARTGRNPTRPSPSPPRASCPIVCATMILEGPRGRAR